MSLGILALWMGIGAAAAAVHAVVLAMTLRRQLGSSNRVVRRVVGTLPLRLGLQAFALYWAVRGGAWGVLGWLLGYWASRTAIVGWALRHTGNALGQG